eukprot:1161459-Prymnesium_polylepis.1
MEARLNGTLVSSSLAATRHVAYGRLTTGDLPKHVWERSVCGTCRTWLQFFLTRSSSHRLGRRPVVT